MTAIPNYERLLDLVRYARHELFKASLITQDEFAALVQLGSNGARRLESYDDLRTKLARTQSRLDALREAVVECITTSEQDIELPQYEDPVTVVNQKQWRDLMIAWAQRDGE